MLVQAAFWHALLEPDMPLPPGLRRVGGLPPTRRFNVYRNNVVVSLVEALCQTFPVVRQMVGMEFFVAMAREFIGAHPPRSPVMSSYGDTFPEFIQDFGPAGGLPYLADLARLEFLQIDAFHAQDRAALAPAAFATVPPDTLAGACVEPHSAARLLSSPYAVVSLWFAHHGQGDLAAIDPMQPETVLVTRPELTVCLYRLDGAMSAFFKALLLGGSLGEAAASLMRPYGSQDLPRAMTLLFESGFASAIIPDKGPSHEPNRHCEY